MDLPRALSPWASYLSLFPRELALALGPLVQRLDLAIGPMNALFRPGSGDPEGFSGLSRRGPYERLLLSEWLLAEEAPDEFARRAAMGEHGFLEITRRQAAGARVCVVLLDGGPDQLGAPKIAQLAAMVVLARRAEVAGSRFLWGQLQDEERGLAATFERAAVHWIVHSRRSRRPTPPDFEAWQQALRGREPAEDLWLIGGRHAAGFGRETRASRLEIEDSYQPETRSLEVTVRQPQHGTRRITLDLPSEECCIRLLRDPFETAVAPVQKAPSHYGAASSLVWGPGLKLMARANDQTLVSYSLPNSPRAQSGKPKLLRPRSGRPILAAGRFRKTIFAITTAENGVEVDIEPLTGRSGCFPVERYQRSTGLLPPVKTDSPLGTCLAMLPPSQGAVHPSVVLFVQYAGQLIELRASTAEPVGAPPVALYPDVLGAAPVQNGIVYASREGSRYILRCLPAQGEPLRRDLDALGPDDGGRVFFGYGGGLADPQFGLIAAQAGEREWLVLDRNGRHTFVPPLGSEVAGVVVPGHHWNGAGLVVLEPGRRSLWVLGREKHHVLPTPSAEIAHVAVSPYDALIAYSTVHGDVTVYSLYENTLLYRLNREGSE